MGYTQKLGLLAQSVFQDSSLNVGIGAAPSGTYKLEVTGTAKVSSTLLLGGALSGTSASFSSTATATAFIPSGATIPTNGMYLSAANTLDFSTNTTNRLTISSTGAATFFSNYLYLAKNQNGFTSFYIENVTGGTSSGGSYLINSDFGSGVGEFGKFSTLTTAQGIISPKDAFIKTEFGSIALVTNDATGTIKMAAGNSSTAHLTIASTGAATFSSSVTAGGTLIANTGTGATFRAVYDSTNIVEIGNYSVASGYQGLNIIGSPIKFYTGTAGSGSAALALTINTTGAATFSSSVTAGSNIYIPNGSYYYAKRNTGGADINVLGIASGSDALTIKGGTSGATNSINFEDTGGQIATFYNGRLGIGTSSPSALLQLAVASAAVDGTKGVKIANTVGTIVMLECGSVSDSFVGTTSVSDFSIRTGNTERMRITTGGAINIVDSYFLANSAGGYRFNNQANTFNNVIMYDNGNVSIRGALSKGSGSFRIDHPLESMNETHQLVHSFIEGPQADLIYRGKLSLVNGKAEANIDIVSTMTEGTFEALCREVQCFTTNESGWDLVKGKVIGNIIYIESQNINSTDEISWMVIGERKDKHMMDTDWTDINGKVIVEPLKPIETKS